MPLRVYAIVGRRPGRRALAGITRPRIRLVTAGAVSAVVSESRGVIPLSARALRGHDALVRRVAHVAPAILPARFGIVVETESSVLGLLERSSKELLEALALVEHREQMTLRLFADADAQRSGRSGRSVGSEGEASHPGTNYLRHRALEQAAPPASELEFLREVLRPIVVAERVVRHEHDPLILTAYHLIPRGGAAAYRRLLRRHAADLGSRAVATGPWAPYGFAPELRR